jgi:hypothetical protein
MIDFPASPTVGQQFTAAGVTWVWDGTKWAASGLSVAFLPLAGGNMSGPIVLAADPAANLQAATKQYVDGVRYGDNRIINGDCRVDQRNNGASGTANSYTVDRWQYYASQAGHLTWGRTSSGPPGFPYSLGISSQSSYVSLAADVFYVGQYIEADMISDFAWGTASVQPVTLSFWVISSLTGTFSGCIANYAGTRSYPFTFAIPIASTWTKITVTIPGDTGGTWVMNGNGGSVGLFFDLGSGANARGPANVWASANRVGATGSVSIVATNGATFYVTGVKLEVGSTATPFNRQSLAKSLADCQRYYQKIGGVNTADIAFQTYAGAAGSAGNFASNIGIHAMRAVPTATTVGVWTTSNVNTYNLYPSISNLGFQITPQAAGPTFMFTQDATTYITLNAEL